MKDALPYYATFLTLVLGFLIFTSYANEAEPVGVALADQLPQQIAAVDLDQAFSFAGEQIPTDVADVRERLDRELTVNAYWQSSTVLNIKNAARYFPVIEPILAEHGVPDDFKYLAVAESSLRPARSPAGARGIWQFMKATAQDYGLEVRGEVDERYHVEKATEMACKYLVKAHEKFGSWTLAAASYNVGRRKLAEQYDLQRAESYYDLNLNPETDRYVFRIVALKTIMQDPARFGFQLDAADYYAPLDYVTIAVDETIPNLGDFARKYGTNYRELKRLNPWLRRPQLTNSKGKVYEIRLPRQ